MDDVGFWKAVIRDGDRLRRYGSEIARMRDHRWVHRWGGGCVYFIATGRGKTARVKIGWTSGDPRKRLSALQSGSPQRLELLGVIAGGPDVEQRLHAFNAPWRVGGEWFRVTSDLIDEIDWSVDWPAEQHAAAKQMGSVRDCEQCASYLAFTRAIQDLYPDA